jgi:putative endonuclease
MNFSVYIVQCADGTLYTGIATDVTRRVNEHNGLTPSGTKSTRGASYTSARRPVTLVYAAVLGSRSAAAKEEARLKRLSRAEKLAITRNEPLTAGGQLSSATIDVDRATFVPVPPKRNE